MSDLTSKQLHTMIGGIHTVILAQPKEPDTGIHIFPRDSSDTRSENDIIRAAPSLTLALFFLFESIPKLLKKERISETSSIAQALREWLQRRDKCTRLHDNPPLAELHAVRLPEGWKSPREITEAIDADVFTIPQLLALAPTLCSQNTTALMLIWEFVCSTEVYGAGASRNQGELDSEHLDANSNGTITPTSASAPSLLDLASVNSALTWAVEKPELRSPIVPNSELWHRHLSKDQTATGQYLAVLEAYLEAIRTRQLDPQADSHSFPFGDLQEAQSADLCLHILLQKSRGSDHQSISTASVIWLIRRKLANLTSHPPISDTHAVSIPPNLHSRFISTSAKEDLSTVDDLGYLFAAGPLYCIDHSEQCARVLNRMLEIRKEAYEKYRDVAMSDSN